MTTKPVRLTIRSSDDLFDYVPYLFGYYVQNSVCVLVVKDGHVGVGCRMDLPVALHPEAMPAMVRTVLARGVDGVFVVGYGEREQVDLACELVEREVGDALWDCVCSDGDQWWSRLSGHCGPAPTGTGRLAAEAVFAGFSVFPDRESLARSVAGPALEREQELAPLFAAAVEACSRQKPSRWVPRMRKLVRRSLDGGTLTESELIELAVLASDMPARDAAWLMMQRSDDDKHVQLWRRVVSVAIERYAIGPVCLLGMASWISGSGTLLSIAIERGVELEPAYSMLHLLEDINMSAIPPSTWDTIARAC